MRVLILVSFALFLSFTTASADPDDLAGGVFIAHYVPELGYSVEPPALGWCEEYQANHAITQAEEQLNRIDTTSNLPASWFVIAAWSEEKAWYATEFGSGQYDPSIFSFEEWNPCYPPEGGMADPIAGWPGPMEGVGFFVTSSPWEGNYVPVMWFGGYAYGYAGSGLVALAADPMTGFVGFGVPAGGGGISTFAVLAENLGGLGVNTDGRYVAPPEIPEYVCCLPGAACEFLTADEGNAAGGRSCRTSGRVIRIPAREQRPTPAATRTRRACLSRRSSAWRRAAIRASVCTVAIRIPVFCPMRERAASRAKSVNCSSRRSAYRPAACTRVPGRRAIPILASCRRI